MMMIGNVYGCVIAVLQLPELQQQIACGLTKLAEVLKVTRSPKVYHGEHFKETINFVLNKVGTRYHYICTDCDRQSWYYNRGVPCM